MQFCPSHSSALTAAIDARGLSSLIGDDDELALLNWHEALERGRTIDNFDPMMGARMGVYLNAVDLCRRLGTSPACMAHGPEQCPVCVVNSLSLEHDRRCKRPGGCPKTPGRTFDHWIDAAADEQLDIWRSLAA